MHALTNSLVAFPDSPGGVWAHRRVPHHRPTIVTHPSGRPWLVGHWPPEELVVAQLGQVRIAVFGCCPITAGKLAALADRVRGLADLDEVAGALPGSAHLVASVHGQVRFQGTITGTRRVFGARLDEVPIASDRADVLAAMIGAEPDEDLLAASVAYAQFITPLNERSWWRGVQSVAPDSYLMLPHSGSARTVGWWVPPEPNLPLKVGALQVREALREAVAGRKPARGKLSADLSGGMDSTSLCFLAAERTPELLTFRWTEGSELNDDPAYAAEAARMLARAEHLEVAGDEGPPVFAPPYSLPGTEAPRFQSRGMNRLRYGIRLLIEHGSGLHLAGNGGDELFTGSAAYLHTLFRAAPVKALRALRVYRALGRWPLLPTLTGLLDHQDLSSWWRDSADNLTGPPPHPRAPALGWGAQVRATPWATAEAVSVTREVLHDIADEVTPLSNDRGQHEAMTLIRTTGPVYRQLRWEYAAHGLPLELPYLDDRVVEAALSVRPRERYTPWRFKPVLAEALREQVPELILNRNTKGVYEEDVEFARQRHLPDLLDLFADSVLAARGLIDLDALRTSLRTPAHAEADDLTANLEMTLGAEIWSREIADPANLVRRGEKPLEEAKRS
ncbi:asparagine synthase-related protein [Amycolatopsis anabasis]|uniref:asparagine synthase-related protein n=1 Tax=Amycolatopsis anabasis TaxID=1840409 RepID=UPI00131DAA9A|nr:asparagine synthase-related protein [Amycolatopsis anabasis]